MSDVTPDRLTASRLGGTRYLVLMGDRPRVAHATTVGDDTWVALDGRTWVQARVTSPAEPAAARRDDPGLLTSPMPATVVSVSITPGQAVAEGEILVRLEAMKMELPIVAPRAGVVRSVSCRPGDLVAPGVPLVVLESA